jgi:hypothetical protein
LVLLDFFGSDKVLDTAASGVDASAGLVVDFVEVPASVASEEIEPCADDALNHEVDVLRQDDDVLSHEVDVDVTVQS